MKCNYIFFFCIFLPIELLSQASQHQCLRDTNHEGWVWTKTIQSIESGNVGERLQNLHDTMYKRRCELQESLPIEDLIIKRGEESERIKKNLLLVSISFILKPTKPSDDNERKFYGTSVFGNHVFISGDNLLVEKEKAKPKDNDFKAPNKNRWQEVKGSKEYRFTRFVLSRKLEDKTNTNDDSVSKVHVISFDREALCDKEENREFFDRKQIALRTCRLYSGITPEGLSKNARLAERIIDLMSSSEASISSSTIIEWYKDAKFGNVNSDGIGLKSNIENYFNSNYDSEQKFLYYVNEITDCTEEIEQLKKIIEKMIIYIYELENMQAGQVIDLMSGEELMSSSSVHIDKLRKLLENANFDDAVKKNKGFEEISKLEKTLSDIYKERIAGLELNLIEIDKKKNDTTFLLDLDSLESIIKLKTERGVETRNLMLLRKLVDQVKPIAQAICSAEKPIYETLLQYLDTLRNLLNDKECRTEKSIIDFKSAIGCAVKENPDHFIETIVLNLSQTFDCCANCAPDLAQELNAESCNNYGRFVDVFKGIAQQSNNNNGSNCKPKFLIVASCGTERLGKWCDKCKYSQEVKPDKYFYQYCYPEKQEPKKEKGVDVNDPANSQ